MKNIIISTIIEGMLLPLSGTLLTFLLYDMQYEKSSIILILNFIHNIPYLLFAVFPIFIYSRKAIINSQFVSSILLLIIAYQAYSYSSFIYITIFLLAIVQSFMHILLASIRKKYSITLKKKSKDMGIYLLELALR